MRFKFLVVVVVAFAAFCFALASGTVTTFKTGPFNVSVDLGMPCDDININKPVHGEWSDGTRYTDYTTKVCGDLIILTRTENAYYDLSGKFSTDTVTSDLIDLGADEDTISVYQRKIDGLPGAVGSGYMPEYGVTIYEASYYVSHKAAGHVVIMNNQTKMLSAIKTIHVTEAENGDNS